MSPVLKKNKNIFFLTALAVILFFVYSWLFIGIPDKFTSPDETANYHFIKLLAEKSQLRFSDSLNQELSGLVQPRSMGYANGYTVPGSFLGIILIYGLIAKVVGLKFVVFLTPYFSAVAVIFFYLLLKEIFSKRTAFISALLLFVLPPFWYYSSRGMFHNALFIDLLIIGLYFLVKLLSHPPASPSEALRASAQRATRNLLYAGLSGLFIGLALVTRTSEIIWVTVVVVIVFILQRKKIKWWNVLLFFGIIVILFVPILYVNNYLYGSPLSFAYSPSSGEDISTAPTVSTTIFLKAKQLLLPFGIHWARIVPMVRDYLIVIIPWFSIGLVISIVWLVRNAVVAVLKRIVPEIPLRLASLPGKQKGYGWLYGLMAVWLIVYYGSYEFYEYINKSQIILGSSYLRYWLPIYVFGLPLVVMGVEKISSMFKRQWAQRAIMVLFVVAFVVLSVHQTLLDPLYGLSQTKNNMRGEAALETEAAALTPAGAVIISGYADKVFFPKYRVIVSMPSRTDVFRKTVSAIAAAQAPLFFYYNPLDNQSAATQALFTKLGYRLTEIKTFPANNEILFRVQAD